MVRVFIYSLNDPRTQKVRYIGKTSRSVQKRFLEHIRSAKTDRSSNSKTYVAKWIRSLLKLGLEPELTILEETSEDEWVEREKFWIAHFLPAGNLTNLSDGGEGASGYKWSLEARQRQSEILTGRTLSLEHCHNISKGLMGKPGTMNGRHHSAATKDKLSEISKARVRTSIWKGKIGLANRGSQNGQAKLSEYAVKEIKMLELDNLPASRIAELFDTTPENIRQILRGVRWGQVTLGDGDLFIHDYITLSHDISEEFSLGW